MTNTDERPVLLLDIDGVLNLIPTYDNYARRGEAQVQREVQRQAVRLSEDQKGAYHLHIPVDAPDLVDQLAEHFDLRWYTMWNEHARATFSPLAGLRQEFEHFACDWVAGREHLDALGLPRNERERLWVAKTPLIPAHLQGRPFCWIDDDTTVFDTVWLREHPEVGEFLLITVPSHVGLTQDSVNEAIAWAQSLALKEDVAS